VNPEPEVAVIRPVVKRNAFNPKTEPATTRRKLPRAEVAMDAGVKTRELARETSLRFRLVRCSLAPESPDELGIFPSFNVVGKHSGSCFSDKIPPGLPPRPPRPLREVSIFVGF